MNQTNATASRPPRVLYFPNESDLTDENRQVGGRAAFSEMLADGTIGALSIYSFLASYHGHANNIIASHDDLLAEATKFKPDIVFWSHPDDYPVTDALILALRTCGSDPVLVYHEGDPFDRLYKRLGSAQKTLYRHSDIFFTVGLGEGRRLFEDIRLHSHLYFAPTYTERERFGPPAAVELLGSHYDAVMIGNIPRRLGVFRHPGSSGRVKLAKGLQRIFGSRFGCFGGGWPQQLQSFGALEYAQQRSVIQTSRMSLMWEHFPNYSFYYSDRLPIALSAGVPFITSARAGHDVLFANVPGLFHATAVQDALDIAVYLRSLSLNVIAELGARARCWVLDNLEARIVFRRMFQTCLECYRSRRSSRALWA